MKRLLLLFALPLPLPLLIAYESATAQASSSATPTVTGGFVALSVADIDASARWYVEKLGLRVVHQSPPEQAVGVRILEGNGVIIEMLKMPAAGPHPNPSESQLVHGIFKAGFLVGAYDELLAMLRARGVAIAHGPFPARPGQRANFIIRDNAGNMLQFFQK